MAQGAPVDGVPERAVALLRWVVHYHERAGYMPTTREMAAALRFSSTASPRYYLAMLAGGGYVVLAPGLARSLCVTEAGRRLVPPQGG